MAHPIHVHGSQLLFIDARTGRLPSPCPVLKKRERRATIAPRLAGSSSPSCQHPFGDREARRATQSGAALALARCGGKTGSIAARGAGKRAGSRRICARTSGFGNRAASKCSICRRVLSRQASKSSAAFSRVNCGASAHTAHRCKSPRAIRSSTSGNRRHTRAAVTLRPAVPSLMRKASTQYENKEQ